jgi:hypothetical protein
MRNHKIQRRCSWQGTTGLLLTLLGLSSGARADGVWVGNAPILGPITLWSAPGNWKDGVVPPNNVNVVFGDGFNSGTTINLLETRHVTGLGINTSVSFSLVNTGTAAGLSFLSLDRSTFSSGTQTIAVPISMAEVETWNINGSGSLAITGSISNNGSITVQGSGALSLGALGVQSISTQLHIESGTTSVVGGTYEAFSNNNTPEFRALHVGATATLNVQTGATLQVGQNGSAAIDGAMNVTGAGSTFIPGLITTIGDTSPSTLTVQSSGAFQPLPQQEGSSSLAYLLVGNGAAGTVNVNSGGKLMTTFSSIGYGAGSTGNVTVSGQGSSWDHLSSLHLGGFVDRFGNVTGTAGTIVSGGSGILTIADSATVTTGEIVTWNNSSSVKINGGTLRTGVMNGTAGSIVLQADPVGGHALEINADAVRVEGSYNGSITGPGTLAKTGTSNQTLTGDNNFGAAMINGGGLTIMGSDRVGSFSIAGTPTVPLAKLNFESASLVITNSIDGVATSANNTDALAVVRSLIVSGRNGGANPGNGIVPEFANGSSIFALAYERVADRIRDGGKVSDLASTPQALLLANTIIGDADMDNHVGFADLVKVAQNYGQGNRFWNDGDFNYDGIVNFADLVSIAQHYGHDLPSAPVPGASAGFDEDMARAFAGVPEPGMLCLMGILPLLTRRRRSLSPCE